MSRNIYALLVGINDYSPNVGKLSGCLNDVDHLYGYLTENFDLGRLHFEILKDADATRPNIIKQFRSHLGKANADDVVVFQYCGHGARWKSAEPFEQFYPGGLDEGLVCYDSRSPGGFDLADKELAALLAELARNEPHIAVILDCCHSGSATRSADDFTMGKCRQTHEVVEERPLESYLDGYYSRLLKRGESLEIPASRHILLAACQRTQKAWEAKDHSGVFTSTLIEALGKSGSDIPYADLFVRCRAMVHKRADNQDPQFETYRGFNAYSGFLGGQASQTARRYSVYFENNGWRVDCGALHGLPSDPDKNVELALYPELDQTRVAGHAATTQVGPQKSELKLLDMAGDPSARYQAEITSLPVPPLAIYLEGDAKGTKALQNFLAASEDHSLGIGLVTEPEGTRYSLSAENDTCLLKLRETGKLIQGAKRYTKEAADYMFAVLKRVAAWERAIELQNHSTKMNPDDVAFKFCEVLDNDERFEFPGSEITIDIGKENGEWKIARGTLKASNRTQQTLHLMLVHFSEDYGFQPLYNEPVEPTDADFTVTLDGNTIFNLALDEDEGDQAIHTFKLIVSTEKVDGFLLGQEPLKLGEIIDLSDRGTRDRGTRGLSYGPRKELVHENEWFTKDLHVKLVRQLDRVSSKDISLANHKIRIKGHPSLKANISLSAAKSATRGVGAGADIYRALERQGMELLNFSSTRGDNMENILELTDIQNPEVLKDNPLEVELDINLAEGEMILPLAFDGEFILLTGDPSRDDEGRTHISISDIPELPDNRRSLGRALKLYFFKAYLKQDSVSQLCWIEYKPDGTFERHRGDVAEKVAAAKNIVLAIHGIIGNTDSIVQGLRLAKAADGKSVDQNFDLVLTYDYENLNTPISESSIKLKEQLAAAGLRESDEKRLTLLVHSMGGLVSRWFIEREGGNKVVDHLVMFGTPNVGSPFGLVDSARQLSSLLTTLAINTLPAFAPFGGALVYLLNRSKKLTLTLEQMNPTSAFIKTLNTSPDPGIPYTIVAGDIRDFKESSEHFGAKLIAKLGTGFVFDTLYQKSGHDIAVSDDSITGVAADRTPAPNKSTVICHHLNYFGSEAGLKAMAGVPWRSSFKPNCERTSAILFTDTNMPDNNSKPVVLLIYANTGSALDCLKPEAETIAAHLEASGLCDVSIIPAATLSDVVTAINDPVLRGRVAIVHYAGHSDGQGIQLHNINGAIQGETAYMRGLSKVFKLQPNLRLVFINGCASREQVLELTQAGISLIIATNRGIDDKVACDFAVRFYHTLGQKRSIADAFNAAEGQLTSAVGNNVRGLYFGDFKQSSEAENSELPWALHGPDSDRHWMLEDPYYCGTGPRWDRTKFTFNPDSPYLGLRYYLEEDSPRFFGRDEFVNTLQVASKLTPLLLVTGASGSGKSSIVRAGMIPRWKKHHHGASRGRAFVFTPQDDPFEQLSTALAAVDAFDRQQIRSVRETPSRTALRDAVQTFGQGEPWLLFVDQFEQIFTRTTDKKKRADFLDAITDLAKSEHPNVCLVLAMRDDFFPQLRDYPELFPLTDKHCFRVAALSRAALQEVIERPAAEHGVTFQPGLVGNIIEAVDRQPGALPLLQYALDALWKADDLSDRLLNEATYNNLGGVTGSLGRRLQDLYDQQDHSGKDHFRWMMLKLVTYDESAPGSSVVSRLAPKSEFVGKQADLLDQLIAQGLVVSSGTSVPSVQLGHEKIIEAWPKFTKWTQECREANTVRQQLSKAASAWTELLARNEKHKTTRALWQGSQLQKALELRKRGDFDQLGGLDASDNRFLDMSHAYSQRMLRGLMWAVGVAFVLMLVAIGTLVTGAYYWRAKVLARGVSCAATAQLLLTQPITEDNCAVIAALAVTGWGLNQSSDAWNAMQRVPLARVIHSFFCSGDGEQLESSFSVPNPDGSCVFTIDSSQHIMRFDSKSGNSSVIETEAEAGQVVAIKLSYDGKTIAALHEDGTVRLIDSTTGKQLHILPHEHPAQTMAFTLDGKNVATVDNSGTGRVWLVENGTLQSEIPVPSSTRAIAICRHGKTLATATDSKVSMVNVANQREIVRLDLTAVHHENQKLEIAFSRDGQLLTVAENDGTVRVFTVERGVEIKQARKTIDAFTKLMHLSPDGTYVACSRRGEVWLREVSDGRELVCPCEDGLANFFFSPDGNVIGIVEETPNGGTQDQIVRILKFDGGNREIVRISYDGTLSVMACSPDGNMLATGSTEGVVRIVSVSDGSEVNRLSFDDTIRDLAFSPSGGEIACATGKVARLCSIKDAIELLKLVHDETVLAVAAPVNGRLASMSSDGNLKTMQSGKHGTSKDRRNLYVGAFNRNGTKVLTIDYETVLVQDVSSGKHVAEFNVDWDVDFERISAVALSDDGNLVGIAFESPRIICIRRTQDGREVTRAKYSSDIKAVDFSRDEKTVVVGTMDGCARILSIPIGQEIARINHGRSVFVAKVVNVEMLATAGDDGTVRLWRTDLDSVLSTLRRSAAGRNLSRVEWGRSDYLNDISWHSTFDEWPTPAEASK